MVREVDTGIEKRQVSELTPGLKSQTIDIDEIPIIDFTPMHETDLSAQKQLASAVYRACTEIGFFYVRNHGVAQIVIDAVQNSSQSFFLQPVDQKKRIDISHSSFNRGYIPLYGEKNNSRSKGDIKETFDMAIEIDVDDPDYLAGNPLYGPNQWPESLPSFRDDMEAYFGEMTKFSHMLYRVFAQALDLPADYFLNDVDKPLDILRLLRYPTQNVVSDESQIGTGAHSDFDCFTILWQDPNGGLQALNREGVWINAPPVDGTMLINVGDMMERWTNGKFVSTVHRVINRSGRERYSMVFFVAPNYSTRIECIPSCYVTGMPSKYRPISAGDYIVTRYNEVIV